METTPDFLHFCFGFLGRLQPVWLRLSAGRVVTWICPNWWMDFLSNAFEFLGRLQPGWLRLIAGRDSTGNPCRRSFELFAASFPSNAMIATIVIIIFATTIIITSWASQGTLWYKEILRASFKRHPVYIHLAFINLFLRAWNKKCVIFLVLFFSPFKRASDIELE